jgi:hypothetical protein
LKVRTESAGLCFTSPLTRGAITTAQGNFRFTPADLKYGTGLYKLGGRVYIDPVPASKRLSNAPGEEDYPATASAPNGDVWLAYVEFHHSPDYLRLRVSPKPTPTDFSTYKQPTGGDQIWARKYSNGAWGQPIAITEKGGRARNRRVCAKGTHSDFFRARFRCYSGCS